EYYIYDPDRNVLTGLERENGILTFIEDITDWISPRLGIRFVLTDETLKVYYPDGQPFLTTIELTEKANKADLEAQKAQLQAQQEKLRADEEKQRANQAQLQAQQEKLRADRTQLENERLRQLLQQAGINIPNDYN
ncbi:Uma2 family endonuclease, partial [Geminocystis sp. CENA526]